MAESGFASHGSHVIGASTDAGRRSVLPPWRTATGVERTARHPNPSPACRHQVYARTPIRAASVRERYLRSPAPSGGPERNNATPPTSQSSERAKDGSPGQAKTAKRSSAALGLHQPHASSPERAIQHNRFGHAGQNEKPKRFRLPVPRVDDDIKVPFQQVTFDGTCRTIPQFDFTTTPLLTA